MEYLNGKYLILHQELSLHIEDKRLLTSPIEMLAFGTDASFYRLTPKMVIKAKNTAEVSYILKTCHQMEIPVTFRAAGTSLSGQAISDSVLIIAGENWKSYQVKDDGNKITLQPGVIGAHANIALKSYQRKIGPDPASINSAMIGGIAANNASGMCCGTKQNSYQTLDSMKVLFYDGTVLDTADKASKQSFQNTHKELIDALVALSNKVKNNTKLAERIKAKFKMKNTTGFSINALVEFDDPFDILQHLMIGSEGTLGFIAEITYKTVIDNPYKANALIIFPDIKNACLAASLLNSKPVAAVELMDRASLRSMEDADGVPPYLKGLSNTACSLLVQTDADSKEKLNQQIDQITSSLQSIPIELPFSFTDDPKEYNVYWKIRKGLYPSVGAMRKTGTTVIIEDVTFPIEKMAQATLALTDLFTKYHYHEAVIFGHALEGNIHFVFNQDFNGASEIERYEEFMEDLSILVVDRFDGSLKAEHGTGRNMAPYVKKQWGEEAYEIMKSIKAIFDPKDLLNPGVILNNDPKAHLKNLKPMPAAHKTADKCTECGFCESACVSHGLTLSPRQRITVYREMQRLENTGEQPEVLTSLKKDYDYQSLQTCATDGLCAIACPVNIDTGKLVKHLRHENLTQKDHKYANWVAPRMDKVAALTRIALNAANSTHNILGTKNMSKMTSGLRKISGNNLPKWNTYLPKGAAKIDATYSVNGNSRKVVYFPSCINQTMGISQDYDEKIALADKVKQLLTKAGYKIIYPEKLSNQCCGMPFSSKGFNEQGQKKSNSLEIALWKVSDHGKIPILSDNSPCLYTMKENMTQPLKLYEPIEFILKHVAPYLDFTPVEETVSVYAVCSTKKMGQHENLVKLAEKCATNVINPDTNCCGFAGDRGFTHPELNEHGLKDFKIQHHTNVTHGYSTSRTCEIGLSCASGISYKSIIYLVDQVTTVKKNKNDAINNKESKVDQI